jgi:hypothetical protein
MRSDICILLQIAPADIRRNVIINEVCAVYHASSDHRGIETHIAGSGRAEARLVYQAANELAGQS